MFHQVSSKHHVVLAGEQQVKEIFGVVVSDAHVLPWNVELDFHSLGRLVGTGGDCRGTIPYDGEEDDMVVEMVRDLPHVWLEDDGAFVALAWEGGFSSMEGGLRSSGQRRRRCPRQAQWRHRRILL